MKTTQKQSNIPSGNNSEGSMKIPLPKPGKKGK